MRIAFINANAAHAYDPTTVGSTALAGAESAQLHLAGALAGRGHDVSLFTGDLREQRVGGIACLPLGADLTAYRGFDALFVTHHRLLSMAALRAAVGDGPQIVAWEHDCFKPEPTYVARLAEIARGAAWLATVSQWHREWIARTYPHTAARLLVIPNAIGPAFADLIPDGADPLEAKDRPPTLAFVSAPRNGLDRALGAFRALHAMRPDARLVLHSGFDHYPPNDPLRRSGATWAETFEACRTTPGVDWRGVVPQPALAQTMRAASILFYPNTIRETSSIACMEAMAAGMAILTHPNAALPETLAGFGHLLPAPASRADVPANDREFAAAAALLSDRFARRDPALSDHLRRQVDHARRHYRWTARAAEVETMVDRLQKQADPRPR